MNAATPDDDPSPATPGPGPKRRPHPLRWLSARLPEARADRALVVATLTAVMVVGGSTLAIVRHSPNVARAAEDAPTLVNSTTTTGAAPTSTTVATAPAPRTVPIQPPENPQAAVPVVQIGEIRIPKIGLVHPVYEGITLTVIDHGPGHWPGSAMPGQLGNVVFAGHRVTHTHPFRNIDQLVPGDLIQFVMPDATYTYKMTSQQIVNPSDTWIVNPTPDATLTLFACHPPGFATHRIVVKGVYVGKS